MDEDIDFSIDWNVLTEKKKKNHLIEEMEDNGKCIPQEEEEEKEKEKEKEDQEFKVSTFTIGGYSLTIREQPHLGIAYQVWQASVILAEYFATEIYFPPTLLPIATAESEVLQPNLFQQFPHPPSWWAGKSVLELGAGTGIPGIYLALQGANVTLTDIDKAIPQLEWNAQNNKPSLPYLPCRTVALPWGNISSDITGSFDVIVGADIVYWEHNFVPLLQTLKHYSSENTIVYIAWQKRRKGDTGFFKILAKAFDYIEMDFSATQTSCNDNKVLKRMHIIKATRKDIHKKK